MTPTRSRLEKMLADRLDFLIGVGHDMRAPLTGIAGFAAILAELDSVTADPTAAEAVVYIRREAQRLVELLNELLDFGQVEQGVPQLEYEPIDLVSMVRQAIAPWASRHPGINFDLVEQGRVVVEGDFLRLHRVLANLIDNAVRHSPPGGTITIEVGCDDQAGFLAVADEGAGVPAAHRQRVFQRFVRLGEDADTNAGPARGAGIGLYVVKGLVEAHGGSVRIEDGARFVVTIPLRQPGQMTAQASVGVADI